MTFLTDLEDPDSWKTQLDAQWDTNVIAKPQFRQGYIGDISVEPNELLLNWGDISLDNIDTAYTLDTVRNTLECTVVGHDKTMGLKMASEVRRITNAWSVTLGKIHVTQIVPAKWEGLSYIFLIIATQEIEGLGD